MEQATIAALTAGEIHLVVPLFEAQLQEHGIASSRDLLTANLRTCLAEPQYGFVVSARTGGSHVGVAYAAGILSLEHGGRSGWLEEFYVLPQWRGHRVGSRLLEAVFAGARERGWRALDLEVDAGHQRTLAPYKRNGFEIVPRTRFVRRFPKRES